MKTKEKYQGWTNWDTWNANLWLTNDEYTYKEALKCRNDQSLAEFWRTFFEGKDDIDTDQVNFGEIFELLHD